MFGGSVVWFWASRDWVAVQPWHGGGQPCNFPRCSFCYWQAVKLDRAIHLALEELGR